MLALLTAFSFSSCEKFLDVNTNPNAPVSETLPLSAKLPAALVSTVNQEILQLNQIGGFWGGYWGTTNEGISMFIDLKTYNGPAIRHQRDGIPVWEKGFNNLLYYQLIIDQAESGGFSFYAGIARIMQGWHFLRLVDLYNNIPFDDALKPNRTTTPAYEEGEAVYKKSIALITRGINDIASAMPGAGPGKDDVLFEGNTLLWKKFGNTLKLRALIRQSETGNEAYIREQLALIEQEGSGFLGAGEHALINPGYLNSNGKLNPFWENYYRNVEGVATANYQDIRPTSFVIEQYETRNDPRLQRLYVPVNGSFNGVQFGNPDVDPLYSRNQTSAFRGPAENGGAAAGLFKSPTQDAVLMSSFESLFLQAEAAQRNWINTGTAEGFYNQAIRESFSYLGVPAESLNPYLEQSIVDLNSANNKIGRIIEQKWLALNSISSIEGWNDFRRLGIPSIPNSKEYSAADVFPLRLMYPETERMTNNENTSKQGNDDMLGAPVWWDR